MDDPDGFDLWLYVFPVIVFGLSLGLVAALLRRFSHHPRASAASAAGGHTVDDVPADVQRQLDDELRDLDPWRAWRRTTWR